LAILVQAYEDEHVPIPKSSLSTAIDFRADQMSMSTAELANIFGGRGPKGEILSGKRALSKSMAARLHLIGVPDSVLLHLLIRDSLPLKQPRRSGRASFIKSSAKGRRRTYSHVA
jgi:hypothetical protein